MSNRAHEGTIYRDVLAGLAVVAVLLAALGLAGCIPIPIPMNKVTSGTEITAEETAVIELGETTRQQIAARLGPPTLVWAEKRVIVYEWAKQRLMLLLLGYHWDAAIPSISRHRLLIEFDEADRVRRHGYVRRGFETYDDMIRGWVEEEQGGKP